MSTNWLQDIHDMHEKFGFPERVDQLTNEQLDQFLEFRIDFLDEELDEMKKGFEERDPEEIVDALIDLCVVAIGTLDSYLIDGQKAWDEVLRANMNKKAGRNPSRPNKFGLPDLTKPDNWKGPSHEGNYGLLTKAFENE